MTVASHAAIGALIATSVNRPLVALPLAFLSHFAADALPHFDYPGHKGIASSSKHQMYRLVAATQPFLLLILLFVLLHFSAELYVYIAALLAVSPDLEWWVDYYFYIRRGKKPPKSPIADFHNKVQWCERPWGAIPESIILIGVFIGLIKELQ